MWDSLCVLLDAFGMVEGQGEMACGGVPSIPRVLLSVKGFLFQTVRQGPVVTAVPSGGSRVTRQQNE